MVACVDSAEARYLALKKKPLTVEKAAILTRDGIIYSVPRPGRHDTVLVMLRDKFGREWLETNRDHRQGFELSDGTFRIRKYAAKVAFDAGQLPQCTECPPSLVSEDLW